MSLELQASHSHIETLRNLLPESTGYIEILIESLTDFEGQQTFVEDPDFIRNYDLISDVDEIVDEIIEAYEIESSSLTEDDRTIAKDAFTGFKDSLSNSPVTAHFLRPFFDKLGIVTIDHEEEKITSTNIYTFFRVPNLNLTRRELGRFLNSLGFIEEKAQGKGSHSSWSDSKEEMQTILVVSEEGKLWLKNQIKLLLEHGVSLERIEEACNKCNIRFEKKKKSVQ